MLLFSEKYNILDELGRGAFSIVKKCKEISTNKCFAAKIFDLSKMTTRELQKLDREARICKKLEHSHIVLFYETITQGSYHYMIFELITGGELFDDIVARECYSELDASLIMKQMLDAIDYCHTNNIIHRDLKPENLLLSSKQKGAMIKLADFGLAVDCEGDSTSWFGFAGTPGYLAPEVVKKVPYGKKVDVWACGVILYILLVGYCPFWDDNNHKLYQQIKNYPVTFDGNEWETVSNEVKNLILLMLNKDPEARLSAKGCRDHPWIKNSERVASSRNRTATVTTIRKFNARRKLKGAILSTLATNRFRPKLGGNNESKSSQKNNKEPNNTPTDINTVICNKNISESDMEMEILAITETYLNACELGDMEAYNEMCDEGFTAFYPNLSGCIVQGNTFQKFYFETQKCATAKSTILHPVVTIFGGGLSAVICYTRIHQTINGENTIITTQFEETLVWEKKSDKWIARHLHRSQNSSLKQTPLLFV